ncbi:DNA-binding SARP family transcriptional activator [Arthrobacter bambusae]|uniref:DNA-binding SARP family transcriptional activator n=1 Tax=Arthrobacter bambusae TaxID=1338426 RepID=A0ABV2PD54_9MICC
MQLELSKRRHREVIAILVALRGRAIPTADLAEELWDGMPPNGAVGAIRTFVGELRRILEPHRTPRTPPSHLVTVGDGYALRLDDDAVDAWRFETAMPGAVEAAPDDADSRLSAALAEWHGSPYQEFAGLPWAVPEASRLSALRQTAVERCAAARLADARPIEAANAVLGSLAVAGDLETARQQRLAAIEAAAGLNDPELAARVIGGYDVPGMWTRTDDPAASTAVVAAAEDALASPVHLSDRNRARLLATIAMESRGTGSRRAEAAEAVALARNAGDSHLLCFALSATSCRHSPAQAWQSPAKTLAGS